eukprot:gb/GEZN01001443.1/.p1 GENE.gb/GEZN01001443.1/~~gb/GEZN01001443.1/.p1  ORF type:complete len:975 (+),score=206.22 gb/GEZN01001443.1/:236-2926(+)
MSRKLAQRTAPLMTRGPVDASAQMLLATKGLDLSKQSRMLQQIGPMLQQIDLSKAYQPESLSELDVERFLEHQHQLLISTAIEECSKSTAKALELQFVQAMQEDWEEDKQRILDAAGFQGRSTGALTRREGGAKRRGEALTRPLGGPPSPGASMALTAYNVQSGALVAVSSSTLPLEQEAYVLQIQRLNTTRAKFLPPGATRQGKSGAGSGDFCYPIMAAFKEASAQVQDFHDRGPDLELANLWDLLIRMVREPEGVAAGQNKQNQQHNQATLIRGARKYAETLYRKHIDRTIKTHKRKAQPGGVPGLLHHLHAFVDMNKARWGQMGRGDGGDGPAEFEKVPFWAQLFLCYRCGELGLAVQLAQLAQKKGVRVSAVFLECLQHRARAEQLLDRAVDQSDNGQRSLVVAEEGLPTELWQQLAEEQTRLQAGQRYAVEPYRNALYNLVGRLSLEADYTLLGLDHTEDYLWWRLSLLWEPVDGQKLPSFLKLRPEALSLKTLQQYHESLGERHFNPDGRHHRIYFQVLLMSLQFGPALNYLLRKEDFTVAVHMSLGLAFYGLVPRNEDQREIYDAAQQTINLQRLLQQYTSSFTRTHPVPCFHYLVLLYSLPCASSSSSKLVLLAMRDLLLSTRNFQLLVGHLRKGRVSRDGALFQFLSHNDAKYVLADSHFGAARKAAVNGAFLDAITLYTLAGDLKAVSELLLTQLSKLAPERSSRGQPTLREELLKQLHELRLFNRDLQPPQRLPSTDLEQLAVLEGIVNYFDLYHYGKLDDALRRLASLRILPMLPAEAPYQKEEVERRFRNLDSRIRLIFGDIARSCMDIYFNKFKGIKQQLSGVGASSLAPTRHQLDLQQILQQYQIKARELNVFIGMNQNFLNVSGDVIAYLMNLEGWMGIT